MVQTSVRPADEHKTRNLSGIAPETSATRTAVAGDGTARRLGWGRFTTGGYQGPNRRLDGLTAVAVVVLMARGLGLPVSGGHLAVDVLLACLGYRFARAVRNDADQQRRARRFWFHQLGPIVAPALLYTAIVTVFWGFRSGLGISQLIAVLGGSTMTLNVLMIGTEAGFFALDHLWLVAVMVQLGVVTPVLVLGGRELLSAERRAATLGGLAALVWCGRLAMLLNGTDAADLAMGTLTRMDGFLLGLAVGVAPLPALRRRLPIALAPLAFAILLLLFVAAPGTTTTPWSTLGLMVPVAQVLAALVLAWTATGGAAGALDRTLDNKFVSWIGQRAISIYVWHHYFALVILADGGLTTTDSNPLPEVVSWPGFNVFATRLVFTLAAAVVSHRFVVVPAMAAAADFLARTRSAPPKPTSNRRTEDSPTGTRHQARLAGVAPPLPDHERIGPVEQEPIDSSSDDVAADLLGDLPDGIGMEAITTIDLSLSTPDLVGPTGEPIAVGQLTLVPMSSAPTEPELPIDATDHPAPLFTRNEADGRLTAAADSQDREDHKADEAPVRRVPRPIIESAPLIDHLRRPAPEKVAQTVTEPMTETVTDTVAERAAETVADERPVRIQLRKQPPQPDAGLDGPPPSLLRT